MQIAFLRADVPLSKSFALVDGTLQKNSYPLVSRFTSEIYDCTTLHDFYKRMQAHAAKGHCLLKGTLRRPLNDESRAGTTNALDQTHWIALDFEALAEQKTAEDCLKLLSQVVPGILGADHIVQYGASHGVTSKWVSAHVYFKLSAPVLPSQLKAWLTMLNLQIPALRSKARLSRTGAAIRWPLDITTCQNDKLLYIAAPTLGKGVRSTFKGERIEYVRRRDRELALDLTGLSGQANAKATDDLLNELRATADLPKRTTTFKTYGDTEILAKPGAATISGIKTDRGFTYFNLNGGDSWGYFHPEGKPDVIFNFKGEPNYLTKELLPDYWTDVQKTSSSSGAARDENGTLYLAFLDPRSDSYWRGSYNPRNDQLDLNATGALKKLTDFLKQHGQNVGDWIPEWRYDFAFDSDVIVDEPARFVNRYQRPELMRLGKSSSKLPVKCPPNIRWLIDHVLCGEAIAVEYFENWLASIYQHRRKAETMWVLRGTEGTGKGMLFNRVIAPIFGRRYCVVKSLKDLEQDFNAYMEECLFLLVDEAYIDNSKAQDQVLARLRNMCVEPTLSIRRMRTDHYMAPNWLNIIVASNHSNALRIPPNDRRHNVGAEQKTKITMSAERLTLIDAEIPAFAEYLASRDANFERARTPLENSARAELIALSRTSADSVADSLRSGDTQFFVDMLPAGDARPGGSDVVALGAYKQVVEELRAGGEQRLSREQIQVIYEWCVGEVPHSPNKFTSFMRHHGILFERMRKGDNLVQGFKAEFTAMKHVAKAEPQKVVEIKSRRKK